MFFPMTIPLSVSVKSFSWLTLHASLLLERRHDPGISRLTVPYGDVGVSHGGELPVEKVTVGDTLGDQLAGNSEGVGRYGPVGDGRVSGYVSGLDQPDGSYSHCESHVTSLAGHLGPYTVVPYVS